MKATKRHRMRPTNGMLAGAFGLLLALLIGLLPTFWGAPTPASAVPQMPHALYGAVTVNGGQAGAGLTVSAKISVNSVLTQYAITTTDSLGRYGYSPAPFNVPADDPTTTDKEGGVAGETVQLFVEGYAAGSIPFFSSAITNVDLSATVPTPTPTATATATSTATPAGTPAPTATATATSTATPTATNTPVTSTGPVATVSPGAPGEVASDDGSVHLTTAAGDVSSSANLQITRHVTDEGFPAMTGGFLFAGKRLSITAFDPSTGAPLTSFTFNNPVRMCITYTDAEVAGVYRPSGLKIKQYNPATLLWEDLTGITDDPATKTVCGYTTHLSYFALAGSQAPPPSGGGGGGGGLWPTATRTPTPTPTPSPTTTPAATETPVPTAAPSATPQHGTVVLSKGWNLISAAYYLKDSSVGAVLDGKADKAFYFNTARGEWDYATASGGAWSGTLTEFEVGDAYWVNSLIDGSLTYDYEPKDKPAPTHELRAGWSMIGFTTRDLAPSTSLSAYLASLSGKWLSVYRYSPDKGFELARPGSGFTSVEYGRGYWVNMSEPGTLIP